MTSQQIHQLFLEQEDAARAAHVDATKGPHNPFGDSGYDSQVWFGAIGDPDTADRFASKLLEVANERREEECPAGKAYAEAARIEDLTNTELMAAWMHIGDLVGAGRPIFVADMEGNTVVFGENTNPAVVAREVESFYC